MKNPFKNKVFRRWFWGIVIVIVLLLLFRVPTRLSVAAFNRQTDLPIGLLEKKPDLSEYQCLGGFGMTQYAREDENGTLIYEMSGWPDLLFGSRQTTRIDCTDPDYSLYDISVGDDMDAVAQIMLRQGFRQGRWDHQFTRLGVVITFTKDQKTNVIKEIVVSVPSTMIFPVVF